MNTSRFHSPEISCEGCAAAIRRAVGGVAGVQSVAVDVPAKVVTVTHDGDTAPVVQAMDKAGFSAQPVS